MKQFKGLCVSIIEMEEWYAWNATCKKQSVIHTEDNHAQNEGYRSLIQDELVLFWIKKQKQI